MTADRVANMLALCSAHGYIGTTLRPVAEIHSPARLLHHRLINGAELASINDAGVLRLLRLATADHPELARLNDADRATLSAAVLALHRNGGPADAA